MSDKQHFWRGVGGKRRKRKKNGESGKRQKNSMRKNWW